MMAHLDEKGVMWITPSTPTEAYALSHWVKEALVRVDDLTRNESQWFRGSKMVVVTKGEEQ